MNKTVRVLLAAIFWWSEEGSLLPAEVTVGRILRRIYKINQQPKQQEDLLRITVRHNEMNQIVNFLRISGLSWLGWCLDFRFSVVSAPHFIKPDYVFLFVIHFVQWNQNSSQKRPARVFHVMSSGTCSLGREKKQNCLS